MYNLMRCLVFILMACTNSAALAQVTSEMIQACFSGSVSMYRTSYKNFSTRDQAAHAYHAFCDISKSYESLSKGQQQEFEGSYNLYSADYGSSSSESSISEKYNAFCAQEESKFTLDEKTRIEITGASADAAKVLSDCLVSASSGVNLSVTVPNDPSLPFSITFFTKESSKKLSGVIAAGASCNLDGVNVGSVITPPRLISGDLGNTANISCTRSGKPITLFGLNGTRYPPSGVTIHTNYAKDPIMVTLPEEVTGELDDKLDYIMGHLVPPGSVMPMRTGTTMCPAGWSVYLEAKGRFLVGASIDGFATTGNGATVDGGTGGTSAVNLTVEQMPAHNHSIDRYMRRDQSGVGHYDGGDHRFTQPKNTMQGEGDTIEIPPPPYLSNIICVKI